MAESLQTQPIATAARQAYDCSSRPDPLVYESPMNRAVGCGLPEGSSCAVVDLPAASCGHATIATPIATAAATAASAGSVLRNFTDRSPDEPSPRFAQPGPPGRHRSDRSRRFA